jgi:tripartite-type tricarboxylate transporter receptor subunit TctC
VCALRRSRDSLAENSLACGINLLGPQSGTGLDCLQQRTTELKPRDIEERKKMPIKLTRRTLIRTGAAAATLPLLGAPAIAQGWPNKPIRFVVSFPAGGATDIFARAYGEYISKQLGQPVIVENKAGAGGTVGAVEVKRSAADGYTLLFTISTTMIMNKVLYKNLPYDPDKDFVLISYMPAGSLPTIVATSTGVTNLKELAEYARKNKTNIGTYAAGSYAHLVVAELNKHYGLTMEAVHYRGESPMWADFLAGSLQGGTGAWFVAQNVLQTGKGRAIAVSQKRMKKLPDVPSFAEQGVTSDVFKLQGFVCVVGPAGMPNEITNRFSALFVEAGKSEKVQALLDQFGIDDSAIGRQGFEKLVKEEGPVWLNAVSSLGLTPE